MVEPNPNLPAENLDKTRYGQESGFLQSYGLNLPSGIKDMFIIFLRQFFSQQSRFTWRDSETETDLIIADMYPEDLQVNEYRPKIIVNRGPIRKANVQIDDMQEPSFGLRGNQGEGPVYSDLFLTTLRFNCFAEQGLEAEELATRVCISIITMREVLRKEGVHNVQEITIEQETNVDSDSEIIEQAVPVIMRFQAKFSWQVEIDAKQLENIDSVIEIAGSDCEQEFFTGLDIDKD